MIPEEQAPERFDRITTAVFGAALFMSAALLFLVQPMFAKALLPLLGGAPAVWNTCVVFYELILLAGYWYAFSMQRRLPLSRQFLVHLALLLLVLVLLPLRVHAFLPPPTSVTAVPWLLITLLVSLGLPLLVLSATSPLLQSWFAATTHQRAHDPYFLYAASNAGSLLGLLIYPFVLEPRIGLHSQSFIWTVGYLVLVVCLGLAAFIAYRSARSESSSGESTPAESTPNGSNEIGSRRKLRWVVLALIPSSLMLSVTSYLSTVIAPIPLLWVVPLALYLLTFIIAFSGDSDARLRRLRQITPIVVLLLVVAMATYYQWVLSFVILPLTAFFLIALTCHSLLAADRPSKTHLTEFYLWLAGGGAAGGIFMAIIAPLIFTSVVEYPLVLIAAAYFTRAPAEPTRRAILWDLELPLLLGVLFATLISLEARYMPSRLQGDAILGFWVAAAIALVLFRRPLGFAASVAALFLCSALFTTTQENRIYVERNFFGVLSVLAVEGYHKLYHGQTMHGVENMRPGYRDNPLSYYARSGPLGQLFAHLGPELKHGSIAVVGLGVGSALCYHTEGQQWTIYEIDPAMDSIARDRRFFHFIDDCAPQTPTVLGDARLSLEKAPDATYDLMILDAYSADYVPVHLVTREAVSLYVRKLKPHGVLAFHITSNWIDLEPVLSALAADADLQCYVQHQRINLAEAETGKTPSNWIALAPAGPATDALQRDPRWYACRPTRFPVWTDDYSSLVTAIPVQIKIGP
jgi:SAM-dependent methyltransferase